MRSRFDAVLFDLFDTLCRLDESVYREGKRRGAALLGLEPEAYFNGWLALQDRCQRGEVATAADRIREVCAVFGRSPDAGILARVERLEREVLLACASLHPDVMPVLRRLRRLPGLRIGLVSNASSPARGLLEPLGLVPYFDAVVLSFEVRSVKPEPAIYLAATAHVGVPPPRCLFIGDGNGHELEGAMEVGMTAVRIERPGAMDPYRRDPSRRWHHSIADLREITDLQWDCQGPGGVSES